MCQIDHLLNTSCVNYTKRVTILKALTRDPALQVVIAVLLDLVYQEHLLTINPEDQDFY
jgi:hypothetical protein